MDQFIKFCWFFKLIWGELLMLLMIFYAYLYAFGTTRRYTLFNSYIVQESLPQNLKNEIFQTQLMVQ